MFECLLQLWPTSIITQSLTVGVVVGIVAYFLLKKRYKLPPGPRGLPFIGSFFELTNCLWYRKVETWSKEYGPVLCFNLGSQNFVVLNTIEVTKEALLTKQTDFAGRKFGPSGDVFTNRGNDIVMASYGPRWKLHRKIASKAIRNYLQGDNLSQKLTKSLDIGTTLISKETGPFDVYPYLSLIVFNILSGMCFNKTSNDINDERFNLFVTKLDCISSVFRSGVIEDFIPFLKYCPTAKFKRLTKMCTELQDAITLELDEHRRTLSRGTIRDFMDALLNAQMEIEKEEDPALVSQITDTHVVQTVQDIFFAGVDTSRITLHWALLTMALHPEIQKKVQAEVDSVIGPDLVVDVNDRDRLSYTEAVLHEVMRMRIATPIGVPHMAMKDSTIGGYDVPKGTFVAINHYALHFDPDQWDEPYTFRPERYLDASGKMGPKPDSWLPFSAGRRVCLGETVAKPELHLLFAGLCRAFTMELAPGSTHDYEPVGSGGGMIAGPYKMVVKPRP